MKRHFSRRSLVAAPLLALFVILSFASSAKSLTISSTFDAITNFWSRAFGATTAAAANVDNNSDSPAAVFPGTGIGAIPDGSNAGYGAPLVVSFAVSGLTGSPSTVSVDMTLTHTWVGDLDVVLAAPGGSPSIPIYSRVGAATTTSVGDSSDLGGTYTFNDAATGDFWAAAAAVGGSVAVPPGSYRTSAPLTGAATNLTATFSGLTAAQANGTWTLTFRDGAAGDTGTVTAANLTISSGGGTPTPTVTPTISPTPSPSCTPSNIIQDGGFEQTTNAGTNPFWTSTSTAFGTSLCTIAGCGAGNISRTGNGYVYFDGTGSTAAESGTVQQSVVFPNGGTASLSYYLFIGQVAAPATSVFTVSIDNTVVQTINEPATADANYVLRSVDVSAYTNGAAHIVKFAYTRPAGAASDSFLVDDVSLNTACPTPTPTVTPTVTPTPPTNSSATIYSVTANNQLVRYNSLTPGSLTTVGAITGLQAGENILGIDFRPATGQLYGLGSTSRLYVIDKMTGAATQVAVLSTPLSGTDFGFDFNPTVDRIRIVSNTGQNLRVNPTTGAVIVDTPLNNPGTPTVTAAAYTNSFVGATTTQLFVIDSNTDVLYLQNPPNDGMLMPVGPLGVDFQSVNGFDYFSGNNTAYAASATANGNPVLYTISLLNGAATAVGSIGGAGNTTPLRGLAVDSGAPAVGFGAYLLTTSNQLIRLNTNRPNSNFGNPVQITGLQAGENILGIDFRPANGQLYGLGSTSRLYVINTATGAATQVGSAGAFTLSGTDFGFDFNPTVDRIRIVSNTGQNLRVNPNDGTLSATDTPLTGGTATAAAYTNSFAGSTTTTLYAIDTNTDTLDLVGGINQTPSPNGGALTPIGSLGFDATGVNGFDITSTNMAFAVLQRNGFGNSALYTIDLASGAASFIATVNSATPIRGLAIGGGTTATNVLDFDGDRRADFSVFRLSNNFVYFSRGTGNPSTNFSGFQFGSGGDIFTPGDYDGDGRTDVAVFRPGTGVFYVMRSSDNTVSGVQFGSPGDEPVARDYDGDGKTDYAVVRRANGVMTWYILGSIGNTFTATQFGAATDVVAPGDYDADGKFDLAVYRGQGSQSATFYVQRSSAGFLAAQFGIGSDLVVPGDYDGDGRTDFAVVRTGTAYTWYILRSSNNTVQITTFGAQPFLTVQNDYDGDGRTDIAVYNQANGYYYFIRSSDGTTGIVQFGQNGDYPIANYDTH